MSVDGVSSDVMVAAERVAASARSFALLFASASRGGVEPHLLPQLRWSGDVERLGAVAVDADDPSVWVVWLPANPSYVAGLGSSGAVALAAELGAAALRARSIVQRVRMERFGEQVVQAPGAFPRV